MAVYRKRGHDQGNPHKVRCVVSNTGETASHPRRDDSEPWRACLRDEDTGEILGAGVVLTEGVVLTCAHVIQKAQGYKPGSETPDVAVAVEVMAQDELASARVMPGCWVPPTEDDRGDVALLRMDRAIQPEPRVQLRRLRCPRGRTVHSYGFPYVRAYGIYASAVLSGWAGPGGEWIQIDSVPQREVIRPGFSGAGVVDERTGAVVGIAAIAYHSDLSHLAWMIPVDVVAEYLPAFREWLGPEIPCDRWASPAGAILIAVGAHDEAAVAGIHVPNMVDAAGKSADEVYRVLRDTPASEPRGSEPVGVTGIEQAQEPEKVLDSVVGPMVRNGATVVLRLSDENSPTARLVRQRQRDALRVRIDALTEGVADLAQREDLARTHRRRAQARLRPPPKITELSALAAELQLPLAALRSSVDDTDPDRLRRAVERFERKLDRYLDQVERVAREADAAMLVLERLRGLVASYNARAVQHGLLEDKELEQPLRAAREALDAYPCDLNIAEARVNEYVRAVQHRLRAGQ
ncbi:Trypsin-like peptidase domain-containing protein [Kibdelosporangium aridum]|uniref:Trypsin-like peptidase domain-containing protein n=1 Tax=Kibdelosporangium aridum TaxID=2030 RepID=A0A1W2FV23_KIBAR|nr:Trypsin-like peptidase domain-containing protein [Kibdelosporangium aridum]